MSEPFIDTDVIVRLITGDDLVKQAAARQLFASVQAGTMTLVAPDTVIADAAFVLASPRLYHRSRADVQALLTTLVRLPGFRVQNRLAVLRALEIFGTTNVDFGDAMIVASMEANGSQRVYSYDRDFGRFPTVVRIEP